MLNSLKKKVEWCLENFPETRNSDIKLTNTIWYNYYKEKLFLDDAGNLCVKLLDIYELPREDNVKRIRAKFNSKGKYLPTDNSVIKKRKLKEEDWRNMLGYNPELRTV